ncbi:hypothetical protein QTJ16_004183 [Diplocarpon rosae]|uniref:Uncharacterized protein n=1 Tax=Diplocarpon rosae TaxID=946125 RepID=A0AAD9SYS3_9HELO|nr:hypothetical protein QTJ16_004183 [Diplocarpon rosae]
MGGNAFISHSPPLSTPRMPLHIYKQVLTRVLAILHQHFLRAASPIEAPGKADYGDIDVLVFSPLAAAYDQSVTPKLKVVESIAQGLGAIAWIAGPKSQAMNFAIPWPQESLPSTLTASQNDAEKQGRNAVPDPIPAAEKFIQLDLHILATSHELDWHLFHDAHGDLCSILGSTIRRFGLTVNHTGMHLRIPSIEAHDRKKSLVFLTSSPTSTLHFLGLDAERWWHPFGSRQEMFEYAAGCRLFSVKAESEIEEEPERVDGGVHVSSDMIIDTSINDRSRDQIPKKKLKSSERQRLLKRPTFRAWMEEFLPSHLPPASDPNSLLTRDQIRAEAFSTFGPAVQHAYNTREKVFLLDKNRDDIWQNAIKENVPGTLDPQILWQGEKPKAAERDRDGFLDSKEVSAFVRANWEEAARLGMLWQREKAVEGMKAKIEKKRRAAEATKERMERSGGEEEGKVYVHSAVRG